MQCSAMHAIREYDDSYFSGYFVNQRSRAAAKSLNFLKSPSYDSIFSSLFFTSQPTDGAKAGTALLNKGSFESLTSASAFTKSHLFRVWFGTCRDRRDLVSGVPGVIGCKEILLCSYR